MRTGPVVEPGVFSPAERSVLRLDGDCFELGLSAVAVDAFVDSGVRAATLLPAVEQYDLVVDGWSAAWVHGVIPTLPEPLNLCVDLDRGRATRAMRSRPREARFGDGETALLGGVRVTTSVKTAFDLLLRLGGRTAITPRDVARHDAAVADAALALLHLSGLGPDGCAERIAAMPKHNGKHRVAALARDLLRDSPDR